MQLLRTLRTGVAAVCAAALVGAPLLVPTTTASAMPAEAAAKQSITIKIAKKAITVRGARALDAGRVKIDVRGRDLAEIVRFDRGYNYLDFQKDVRGAFTGDMRKLRRAIDKTEFVGGVAAGHSGTVVLPRAGDYTIFSFGSKGPGPHETLTVGRGKAAPAPEVDGKIVGRTGNRFSGSTHFPAKGRFLFKNADRKLPHMVVMQQVAEGTSIEQVQQALMSEEQGPPPEWFLPAGLETASLSPGRKMTVNYDLPAGQYVVMCFFPDPRMDGMPHAMMGMLRMVHLM